MRSLIGTAVFLLALWAVATWVDNIRTRPTTPDQLASLPATASTSTTRKTTPAPPVEGPTYADYAGKHEAMTDAQWAVYIKTLTGNHISNWQGWVEDVVRHDDSVYYLKVDEDGPDEVFAAPEIIIWIAPADATLYNKHTQVTFSGIIDHVDCSFGACQVVVRNASISR